MEQHDEARPRTPWNLEISIFKDFRVETPSLINECFEFDWNIMKVPKLKGTTDRDLKERIRQQYPFIRELYKRLSGTGIKGSLFSIGWNVFRDFMIHTIDFTSDNKFKREDCDRLFIGVNASSKGKGEKTENNSDKSLCRNEFLEIIIRSAMKKYCENGELENEGDAVDRFWNDYLHPYKNKMQVSHPYQYDTHKWRINRFWNEHCDNIFKAYSQLFLFLFNKYGGMSPKPSSKVDLQEFSQMIEDSGILNDKLKYQDIPICFA
jgi:hypothetical protein